MAAGAITSGDETFRPDLCTAVKYEPPAVRRKISPVQAYLHSGDCYQVNLAQRFQASYVGDEWQAFRQLNAVNRAPFSAFIRLDEGAILSLSPERFIQLRRGEIQTRPIKAPCRGSIRRWQMRSRLRSWRIRRKIAPRI